MRIINRLGAVCLFSFLLAGMTGCPNKSAGTTQAAKNDKTDRPIDGDADGAIEEKAPANPPNFQKQLVLPFMTQEDAKTHKLFVVSSGWVASSKANVFAFTPDAKLLIAGGLVEGTWAKGFVRVWELPQGTPAEVWGADYRVLEPHHLAVTPDGKRLFATFKDGIAVYDLAARKVLSKSLGNGLSSLPRVNLHPNGRWLVTVDYTYQFWPVDVATGKRAEELAFWRKIPPDEAKDRGWSDPNDAFDSLSPEVNGGFAFQPDSRFVVFTGSFPTPDLGHGPKGLWRIATTKSADAIPSRLTPDDDPVGLPDWLFFTPDGRRLVGVSHPKYGPLESERPETIRVWRTANDKVVATGKIPVPVRAAALSHDGHWLAVACEDGQVRLFAVATGAEVLALKGHTGPVLGVTFSKDGKLLASGGEDGNVLVWKAAD